MFTRVQIPRVLTSYAGGQSELPVSAATVAEALAVLRKDFPALHQCVCDETGAVRRHINLFVNSRFLHDLNGLQTELVDGDVLSIFQAVSGG